LTSIGRQVHERTVPTSGIAHQRINSRPGKTLVGAYLNVCPLRYISGTPGSIQKERIKGQQDGSSTGEIQTGYIIGIGQALTRARILATGGIKTKQTTAIVIDDHKLGVFGRNWEETTTIDIGIISNPPMTGIDRKVGKP
jgi:hypothetical protein